MNYLPVRPLMKYSSGDGAWIIAQKAEQRKQFKAIICALNSQNQDKINKNINLDVVGEDKANLFCKDLILDSCKTVDPNKIAVIKVDIYHLHPSNEEFSEFTSVYKIQASVNYLNFDCFVSFSSLTELYLSSNGLKNIKIDPQDFENLQILDVSFNELTVEDVMMIGLLKNLQKLSLSGNSLNQLPAQLHEAFIDENGTCWPRFNNLEQLNLENNNLSLEETFSSLGGLSKLKILNLSRNRLTSIPLLHATYVKGEEPAEQLYQLYPYNGYDGSEEEEQFPDLYLDDVKAENRIPSTLLEEDEESVMSKHEVTSIKLSIISGDVIEEEIEAENNDEEEEEGGMEKTDVNESESDMEVLIHVEDLKTENDLDVTDQIKESKPDQFADIGEHSLENNWDKEVFIDGNEDNEENELVINETEEIEKDQSKEDSINMLEQNDVVSLKMELTNADFDLGNKDVVRETEAIENANDEQEEGPSTPKQDIEKEANITFGEDENTDTNKKELLIPENSEELIVEDGSQRIASKEILKIDFSKMESGLENVPDKDSERNYGEMVSAEKVAGEEDMQDDAEDCDYSSNRKVKVTKIARRVSTHLVEINKSLMSYSVTEAIKMIALQAINRDSFKPFPALEVLDLSHNRIKEEKGIISAVSWVNLRRLSIHDNPLTLTKSQKSSFVKELLQNAFKITVDWLPPINNVKLQPVVSKSKIDVSDTIPMMPPKFYKVHPLPDTTSTEAEVKIELPKLMPVEDIIYGTRSIDEKQSMQAYQPLEDERKSLSELEHELLHDEEIEIKYQSKTNLIKALKYQLNHPITYFDRRVDLFQKQQQLTSLNKRSRKPEPPQSEKHQSIEAVLQQQNHRRFQTEISLEKILSPDYYQGNRIREKEFKVASRAIHQMQSKYNQIRQESLKKE